MTDLNLKDKAEYLEFQTKAKFLGINDKDSLIQLVRERNSLQTWRMVGGAVLALAGLLLTPFLLVFGVPMVLGGVWFAATGNKRKNTTKRVASAYARNDLGIDIAF